MNEKYENLIYLALIAEIAERYEDMMKYLIKAINLNSNIPMK